MALMTGEQYIESIRKIPMEIYMFGKKVENPVDNPILRPSLNSVRMTYDLAQMPEYQDLTTVTPSHTGERFHSSGCTAPAGPEDRRLLPALRGHGRLQRRVCHHLRG